MTAAHTAEPTAVVHEASHDDIDRNLAFLTYALLFFSIFFAGVPALIAVAIAYARRRDADALARGHHAFQIWIFWVGFLLALLAGAAGLSAILTSLAAALRLAAHDNWNGWGALRLSDVVGPASLSFAVASGVLGVSAAVWLVVTSVYGAVRLASNRGMRQSRG